MEIKEIRAFVDDVYKQCVDKGMTYDDFGRFALEITKRKSSVTNDICCRLRQLPLPNKKDP